VAQGECDLTFSAGDATHQEVGGLKVAVDDVFVMQPVEAAGNVCTATSHGWIPRRSAPDHTLGDADDALLAHGRGEALLLVLQ
jgi:hypothetical protein